MSDPTQEPPAAEPTPEDHAMAAVDAALAPALGRLRLDAGPVHSTTLVHVIGCVRQALAHAIYGAPDPVEVTGESLDVATLQRKNGAAYAAYLDQCKADGVEPDDLPTFVANQGAAETEELNEADGAAANTADADLMTEWASMTPAARTAAWAEPNHGGLDLAGIVDPDGPGGANVVNAQAGAKLFA